MNNVDKFIDKPHEIIFHRYALENLKNINSHQRLTKAGQLSIMREVDKYFNAHSTSENEKYYSGLKQKISKRIKDFKLIDSNGKEEFVLNSFDGWLTDTYKNLGVNMVDLIKNKTEQIKPLDIEKAGHKILILHELGVLDNLRKNYSILNIDTNTNLSKLLAPLLNEKTETIRKALENIHERKPKGIINKVSVRKVKAELSKLGIETKTLPDL